MSTTTSRLGLHKPEGPESMALVNTHWNANLDKLDAAAPFRRSNTAGLPASPYLGQTVVNSDNNDTAYIRGASTYLDLITPESPATASVSTETDANTSSGTFTSTGGINTTFTAPVGGLVVVNLSCTLDTAGTSYAVISFQIRLNNSGGALFLDADDRRGLNVQGPDLVQSTMRVPVSGLTPLTQTYFIRTMLRSEPGGTNATFFWQKLAIESRR